MIIDFHAHAFPKALSKNALTELSKTAGGLRPNTDGTAQSVVARLIKTGVDKAVLLNIATKPSAQTKVNDFALSTMCDHLIPFGSVHPDAPDVLDEIERIAEMGLKGIKFHPDYQNFFVDEPRMKSIYKKIAKHGLITVFHAGWDIGIIGPCHATPKAMRTAVEWFGGAPVVAAHMGGYCMWEDVLKYLPETDCYLDSSYSFGRLPIQMGVQLVERFGADRILLGSDMPWSDAIDELNYVKAFGVSGDDLDKIVGGNAQKLLGI